MDGANMKNEQRYKRDKTEETQERKLKIYTLVYDEGKTDAMIRITA